MSDENLDSFPMACFNRGYQAYHFSERGEIDCDQLVKSLNQKELRAFVDTNREVEKRKSYGMRTEQVEKDDSTFLFWSNGSRRWFAADPDSFWAKDIKKGNEIRLDANHVLVPYPYRTVKKFVHCLKTLPLYYCSTEAKQRGEVDSFEATFCWALKQLERIRQEEYQKENK